MPSRDTGSECKPSELDSVKISNRPMFLHLTVSDGCGKALPIQLTSPEGEHEL